MSHSIYIFDVDGVLNDLKVYESDSRILSCIADLLKKGTHVAINTGRGYAWIEEQVVRPVRQILKDDVQALQRLFVSVEMGGLGVEFPGGIEQKNRSAFSLSLEQIERVHQFFNTHAEYADRIHWYPKESMATIDKNRATPIEIFKPIQKELTDELRELLKDEVIEVANSTDAIDIHAVEAGKRAGAQLIYEWLRRTTDVQHDRFVCFGDSIVDYEMARFFSEQNHHVTFVFTGPTFTGEHDPSVEFIKSEQPYNEGTYRYLHANL